MPTLALVTAADSRSRSALAELARVEGVQSQHKDLCRTIDQLARMNAATEQDNRQLAEQNTELISHGNPHQKIRHVAQIREELAESRRVRVISCSSRSTLADSALLHSDTSAPLQPSPRPKPRTPPCAPSSRSTAPSRPSPPLPSLRPSWDLPRVDLASLAPCSTTVSPLRSRLVPPPNPCPCPLLRARSRDSSSRSNRMWMRIDCSALTHRRARVREAARTASRRYRPPRRACRIR